MLQELNDVFPDEVLGLPPKRNIDFTIDLVLGSAPMSKTPYKMSTSELLKLKMQLQELSKKKYNSPSVSPWGAPILFVKNKDGIIKLYICWRHLPPYTLILVNLV